MSELRKITKEMIHKAYRRWHRASHRISSGIFNPNVFETGVLHQTGVTRIYFKRRKSGRLDFYYRVGRGRRFAKISVGLQMITLTVEDTKKQHRAFIPFDQEAV